MGIESLANYGRNGRRKPSRQFKRWRRQVDLFVVALNTGRKQSKAVK
jgi:hypothetical protein